MKPEDIRGRTDARTGAAAALAVAGVYGFFLLFAQFSFLGLMRLSVPDGWMLKATLAAMAFAGMASGFLAAARWDPRRSFTVAMGGCVPVALAAIVASSSPAFLVLAVALGGCLGAATVALAERLRRTLDRRSGCGWIGLGTGLAYAGCNLPPVFAASPERQAGWSAAAALAAVIGGLLLPRGSWPGTQGVRVPWRMILVFGALVWMDSAAFYVIQHESAMKGGTWGDSHLWRNAMIHLVAALLAGAWLSKGSPRVLAIVAWGLLALAAWWVNDPAMRHGAGWLYPAAVSLYSTALVSWPALLAEDAVGTPSHRPAMWRAAWLFGIAGWLASGCGIVAAGSLQRVPGTFLLIAGAVVVAGCWGRTIKRHETELPIR